MKPRPPTHADLAYWDVTADHIAVFSAPSEVLAGVEPCAGIITPATDEFGAAVRVPWQLDEIELAHLARGGTLWLSTWGGL